MATATFAAGCFWGVEARFRCIPGVIDAEAGYTGGHSDDPSYEEVCSHTTGHAEAVRVEYDPQVVTYEELLDAFFAMHDPTTLNRQGPDIGDNYRSAIFYHTDEQQRLAQDVKRRLQQSGAYRRPIVTQIEPAGPWWRAEEYHQRFNEKHGRAACRT